MPAGLDPAIDLIVTSLRRGGVLQAFGTGHSQAFAMEIAGRAGGLHPDARDRAARRRPARQPGRLGAHRAPRSSATSRSSTSCSRCTRFDPADVFLIASNSGVNGSIVGVALRAKADGHPVIAVTSLEHTNAVTPKHPSGKRLSEIADVVIDNRAPYGDTTIERRRRAVGVGAVSSITAAYIAQLLTIGAAQRISALGETPPIYISANIPGGDEHNHALEAPVRRPSSAAPRPDITIQPLISPTPQETPPENPAPRIPSLAPITTLKGST